jgi:hypothetical protein
MKTYSVQIYYSTFCTHSIDAEDEYDAIEKARQIELDKRSENEILCNLDHWKEADQAFEE